MDGDDNLFVADTGVNEVCEVGIATGGTVVTVAGTGIASYNGDGIAATAAELNAPRGVCVTTAGDLYIADTGSNIIREVTAGVISTVVGDPLVPAGGTAGYAGDSGPAVEHGTQFPDRCCFYDNVNGILCSIFPDTGNDVIRQVQSGVITTFAGVPSLLCDGRIQRQRRCGPWGGDESPDRPGIFAHRKRQ